MPCIGRNWTYHTGTLRVKARTAIMEVTAGVGRRPPTEGAVKLPACTTRCTLESWRNIHGSWTPDAAKKMGGQIATSPESIPNRTLFSFFMALSPSIRPWGRVQLLHDEP